MVGSSGVYLTFQTVISLLTNSMESLESHQTGGHCNPCDYFIGQDTINTLSGQNGLPNLLDNWEHPERHMLQAVMPCTDSTWLYSSYQVRTSK